MKVTDRVLRRYQVHWVQRDIFKREWPEGVELSVPVVVRMLELNFSLTWAASWVLTWPTSLDYYEKLGDIYRADLSVVERRQKIAEAFMEALALTEKKRGLP